MFLSVRTSPPPSYIYLFDMVRLCLWLYSIILPLASKTASHDNISGFPPAVVVLEYEPSFPLISFRVVPVEVSGLFPDIVIEP